jgi:hypothetical protein
MILYKNKIKLFPLFFIVLSLHGQESNVPFKVNSLFIFDQPETLGLPFINGLETITIFSPQNCDNKYNHGVVLFPYKGILYAQWQSSSVDEDGEDTKVFYSKSTNGKDWNKPTALTKKWEHGIKTSGGWWSNGDTLVAYIYVFGQTHTRDIKKGILSILHQLMGSIGNSQDL